MKNVAIAYATHHSLSSDYVFYLTERLRAMNLNVQSIDVEDPDAYLAPDNDAVLLGGTVASGRFSDALLSWAKEHRAEIVARPSGLFAIEGRATDSDLRKFMNDAGCVPNFVAHFDKLPANEESEWPLADAFLRSFSSQESNSSYSVRRAFPHYRHMDDQMRAFEYRWEGFLFVSRTPEETYAALASVKPDEMKIANILTKIRTLGTGGEAATEDFLTSAETFGNIPLLKKPPTEIIAGLVGQFWKLDFGIRRMAPSEFARFNEAGYVKVVSNFRIEPQPAYGGSRLSAEMRVRCTSPDAAFKFGLYWMLLNLGIKLFMWSALFAIKRHAERAEPILKAAHGRA